jgi:hypothetical protein
MRVASLTLLTLLTLILPVGIRGQTGIFPPPGSGGSGTVTSVTGVCGVSGSVTVSGSLSGILGIDTQSGTSYAIPNSDCGKTLTFTASGAVAVTIAQAGTGGSFPSGWYVDVQEQGAGGVTITPNTSTVDGGATVALAQHQSLRLFSNGTNYITERGFAAAGATPAGAMGAVQINGGSGAFGDSGCTANTGGQICGLYALGSTVGVPKPIGDYFEIFAASPITSEYQWEFPAADPGAGFVMSNGGVTPSLITTTYSPTIPNGATFTIASGGMFIVAALPTSCTARPTGTLYNTGTAALAGGGTIVGVCP